MINTIQFSLAERIGNHLILNSPGLPYAGIANGQVGDAVCLYSMYRKTGIELYEEMAGQLLDSVYEKSTVETLPGFSYGLAGIGCAVQYLVNSDYIKADGDVLVEINDAILQLDRKKFRHTEDFSDFYAPGLYYLIRTKEKLPEWNREAIKFLEYDLTNMLSLLAKLENPDKIANEYLVSLAVFIFKRKNLFRQDLSDSVLAFVKSQLNLQSLNVVEKTLLSHCKIIEKPANIDTEIEGLNSADLFKTCTCFTCYNLFLPEWLEELYPLLQAGFNSTIESEAAQKQLFDSLFGFEGIAGIHPFIQPEHFGQLPVEEQNSQSRKLYVFNETSRAGVYGIGTYISELVAALQNTENLHLNIIKLNDPCKELEIETNDGVKYWKIPSTKHHTLEYEKQSKRYYQSVVRILKQYAGKQDNVVAHFNYSQSLPLLKEMKTMFDCKTVAAVHYSQWGFVLHENINRLRSIISGNDDVSAQTTLKSLENEKSFLSAADHIVCLASYMKDLLCNEYQLKQKNISIIPNGLRDMYKQIDVKKVKQSHFFSGEEKIILFAGRLDEIKGLSFLIKAFREVLPKYPSCRLLIAGSGSYDIYMKEAKDICSKITYTGLLEKCELYELYRMANVGVVPSLYEPFGYVAAEMMMHALPVVVTATSGLNEMVDEHCGIKIPIHISENRVEPALSVLSKKILYLLQHPDEAEKLGKMARKKYLDNYSSKIFRSNMIQMYTNVLKINTNKK